MAYIIVADDDPLLGDLVRFKLAPDGHRILVVENGQAALDAIALETPDILILDSMMPILSGKQVLQQIKASPATASIPVLMLTARKGQDDVVAALQSGADDYITKPFMPDELLLRIRTVLARFGASDALE